MKVLYVIRHAKSSWDDPDIPDFERALNDRGKRDAPRMGKRLKEREIHPDLIISSPAKRAYTKKKKIAEVLQYSKKRIKTDQHLYHASEDTLLEIVQSINDKHNSALIFGHNPGLTDFANALAAVEVNIDNIPTCGIIAFKIPVSSWKEVGWKSANMLFFDYPKAIN